MYDSWQILVKREFTMLKHTRFYHNTARVRLYGRRRRGPRIIGHMILTRAEKS